MMNYTTIEAAAILRLVPRVVRHYCATGKIDALRFGHSWMIPEQAIHEFKQRRRPRGRPKQVRSKV